MPRCFSRARSLPSSTGRATATWTDIAFLCCNYPVTSNFAYYVIDANAAFVISTDQRSPETSTSVGVPFLVGEVRRQQLPLDSSSLSNAIFYSSGLIITPTAQGGTTGGPVVSLAALAFQPATSSTGTVNSTVGLYQNINGASAGGDVTNLAYSIQVPSPGSNLGAGRVVTHFPLNGVNATNVFYLTDANRGFGIWTTGAAGAIV